MFGRLLIFAAFMLAIWTSYGIVAAEKNGLINPPTGRATENPIEASSTDGTLSRTQRTGDTIRGTRVVFITAQGCDRCLQELNRLRKPGGEFEAMRLRGWKIGEAPDNHVQIIDREVVPELIEQFELHEFPLVVGIENGTVVRSYSDRAMPLDAWTFGWLLKGKNERPQATANTGETTRTDAAITETTGNYRLRGNHWTLEGDPNPAKPAVVTHLRGPNHGHASAAYGSIENWSYEELRSLHDDLHEREGGTYGVYAQPQFQGTVAANRSLDAFAGGRKAGGK